MGNGDSFGQERGLRWLRVDLHLHTVVSACAEVEMIPPFIVDRARELGLNMIAVTDHNTAENVVAVQRAADGSGIVVVAGMEVQTREEAHILCLFATSDAALTWQEVVYSHLPDRRNRDDVFGAQFVVDETGDYVRTNERLLLTSVSMSAEQVVDGARALGGLAIAAHVDRPSFSLLANLGFVPDALRLNAIEISRQVTAETFRAEHPELAHRTLIASGDAHRLIEMRAATTMLASEPSFEELALALAGVDGRRVDIVTEGSQRAAHAPGKLNTG